MSVVYILLAILGVGVVGVGGATVSGQQQALCEKVLGGTWTPGPYGSNVCPGGHLVLKQPRQ